MHVKFSDLANGDIDKIKSHITKEDSSKAAESVIQRILQAVSMLETFPLIGRIGRIEGTRELSIVRLPYYAVYHIDNETELTIITVIHDRQQYPADD